MFLSTENPPHDPLTSPSPSSLLHLTTTSSYELGQSHLQNFSIRDYAYSNRKKNIKNSWPFSPKSLQLCSSHGVTDPLPPFQKLSNVSNKFETRASSTSKKQILSHVHRGSDLPKLGVKGSCSQSRIDMIIIENGFGTSPSVSKSKIVVAGTSSNNNKNNKKCGRVGGMVKSKEDTCGVVMTTTTCPICKTFSSASNTTLNAHMDQCLSVVDSELPPVSSTKPNKPKVKPKMKVKTMVDIYASAKRCTLEDLDKRNGTNWVSVLSHTNQVAADKSEVSRKRKVSPVGVGPVYIDAKGKKLRILTEFSEKKTSSSSSTIPLRDGSKESSKSLRKRRGGKKHYKYLKLTNLKANNTSEQTQECERGFSGEGSSKGHRRIYNQRMLATRGLISKKLNEKGHKSYALRDQPSEDDDDDSWSGGERIVLRGTDSSPLNKQKEVSGRSKSMFGSKGAQSRSFKVQMSEKKEKSLARTHLDTVKFKNRLASIKEDKYPLGKNIREEAASSMRKLSAPFVSNGGWRRQSFPVELKKARLDSSEEEEEAGKWESEMTEEREVSDNGNVSGSDDSPSFSRYDDEDDDDDEESNDEEEEEDSNDARLSNETIPTSERAMYYFSEEAEEMIYGQTTCDEDVRGKGSLFVEVDTIPIPGPPGSFLPSPRDMCYDENLGNSSVITSQFHSFDRNSSESPVSNFASGKLSFCVPSHHDKTITEAELMTVDKTEPPPRLGSNDDQSSCCCQRKERISEGIALNHHHHHQSSHLLQRRAAAYSSRLDPNHPFEEQDSSYMIQQHLDLQSNFSNRAVVVPPSPNPVLRLMGKDLMVMNNQVEASHASLEPTTQFLDPHPCAGTGLCFNTGLYLRNSFESAHTPQNTSFTIQKQF